MANITILDGGMGRELKRIGAPFSQPLWSAQALIESPKHVKQAHQGFIEAGAQIITVNSYACVPFHLGAERFAKQGAELAKKAARIAQEVASESQQEVLVAGSIPPAFGSYRPDLFEAASAYEISSTLFDAQDQYVDIWLAETVASLAEAAVISKVLAHTDKPVYISFTLMDEVDRQSRLRSGELVTDAVEALFATNAAGIFFNCSVPEVIEQAILDVNQVLERSGKILTIGVFANSFTPIKSGHQANDTIQTLRNVSPQEYLEFAQKWHQLGASIIGGCCGIEPSHIKALATWRDSVE
ncbi:homocysteine S-methyltransferase family protein [Vibrio gazogenes]|uniref:Homocysteine/selenocysteine methylase (S-methylmethionine-dependent) n=1 Tax=Vibrio gazogenes DSM 21264 = NBRC 103151 TaxID=1123492 RepID=A0A1M4Z985_VIBGA|nr:homocysteine S-methyltransferase family protein [Vibrio gazogenes]USP12486.1 homocysteine S-methyltransferase family protein [Vibrio gazogenes]SHF14377.1 Homocysteine/selenocysteine methylase (S-methylmethionine-dependent) [Vibrio gazogenes DSM 21264] [Vibrio gazogenes DSM 21264 = NBRC 103151]SJN53920.1 Homocysteine S-methyltransferase [Vibrio gazogenes]